MHLVTLSKTNLEGLIAFYVRVGFWELIKVEVIM
jgi:hypothetical protein